MTTGNKRRALASGSAHGLPVEMMTEVFLRLPVKSILRFRAVCRFWAAELSSEEFCRLHMAKAETGSVLPKLFFTSPTAGFGATNVYLASSSGSDDDLLFTVNDARGCFLDITPAPCRGLTLLQNTVAPAYYVFNAATRAVICLPPCQDLGYGTAGLGFDAQSKKYKVVRLFRANSIKQRLKCEIYTLGCEHGDCWRPAAGGVPFRFCTAAYSAIQQQMWDKLMPVFANGYLHWLTSPSFAVRRPRAGILAFSVTDETFRWVQSPPFVAPGVLFGVCTDGQWCMFRERAVIGTHLVELSGHLCMLRDLRNTSSDCNALEIWKLNHYNSGGWSLEHCIDLSVHVARDLIEPEIVKVIGSVSESGSTNKVIIATSKGKVIIYDPVLGTLETILAIGKTHSHRTEKYAFRVSLFKESIVPLHRANEETSLSAPLAMASMEILSPR